VKTKIFGACFLGGTIGAAVALQVSPALLGLAIGILLGGAIGYVAVAPLGFILGVGHCLAVAWQAVTGRLTLSRRARVMLWLLYGSMIMAVVCYVGAFLLTMGFVTTMLDFDSNSVWQILYFAVSVLGGLFGSALGFFFLCQESETPLGRFDEVESSLKAVIEGDSLTESQKDECCQKVRRDCMKLLLCGNGFTGMLYGVLAVAFGILLLPALALAIVGIVGFFVWHSREPLLGIIRSLPGAALRFVRAFILAFFRVVHSEARVTCGVSAMVGVVIGWAGGNPLLGGISGGVVGVGFYSIAGLGLRILPLSSTRPTE
jgi:MFS family permease